MAATAYWTDSVTNDAMSLSMELDRGEIARALRRRDPAVLERLIDRYQHRLLRFLWYFTRDRSFAEDVFQETWLRVLERGHQYDRRFSFEAWLVSIARNLAIDRLRRRRPESLDEPREDGEPMQVAASDRDPFEAAVRNQEDARVAQALDALPAYYREALTLRFHEDMRLEEIARLQATPLSTVKSRLRRALDLLARRLERSCG
jgi:RNA polymerase sigma-70 factor (ECF subfamily)